MPDGVTVEYDGPLIRLLNLDRDGFLTYTDLGGLDGAELDALIERQRAYFTDLSMAVEWKLHGHDEPADLATGCAPPASSRQEQETVVIGPVAALAAALPVLPEGVRLREVSTRADLDRIAQMEEAGLGSAPPELADDGLERELATSPQELTVVVAEADDVGGERRLGPLRHRHRIRDAVGRLDAAAVASAGHLPGSGHVSGPAGGRPGLHDVAGGRVRRQPSDPRTSRVRSGHHDHAVRVPSVTACGASIRDGTRAGRR